MTKISKNLIYGLQDPFTYEIRYIGKSTSGLQRAKNHFNNYHLKRKQYVYSWIKSVLKKGKIPNIIVIQEFNEPNILFEAEKYWIKYYKSIGCKLTNLTDGGEGSLGRKFSEETKRKISLAHLGKISHNKGKPNLSAKGKKQSIELINKRFAKKRELKKLKIFQNRSKSNKKIKTKIIDNNGIIYESYSDAARKIFNNNLYRSTVREICNGKRKSYHGYTFKKLEE